MWALVIYNDCAQHYPFMLICVLQLAEDCHKTPALCEKI